MENDCRHGACGSRTRACSSPWAMHFKTTQRLCFQAFLNGLRIWKDTVLCLSQGFFSLKSISFHIFSGQKGITKSFAKSSWCDAISTLMPSLVEGCSASLRESLPRTWSRFAFSPVESLKSQRSLVEQLAILKTKEHQWICGFWYKAGCSR